MPFQFERIKNPEGVEDSAIVDFDNKPHFAISFGTEVQIYNLQNCVHSFRTKFYVQKILPFQKHFFLIGKNSYCVCKDRTVNNEIEFSRKFSKILKVLNFKNSFVFIFDQRKFLTGTINNYRLEFDTSLNDNHFFSVLSAAVADEKINVLVSTFSKRFMIIHTTEGVSCLKSTRKEIQNGNVLVPRKEDFLLFDEQGMWQYGNKQTFIKEFANYKITSSVDDSSRTVVFCENGEVIVINRDNSHFTAGFLDCPITNVSVINGIFLCTSIFYSYFIKITESIEIITGFGSYNKNESLLSIQLETINENASPFLEIASQKTFKKVEYLVQSCDLINSISQSHKKPKAITELNLNIKPISMSQDNINSSLDDNYLTQVSQNENFGNFQAPNITSLHSHESSNSQIFISNVNSIIQNFKKFNFKSCMNFENDLIINFDCFSIFKENVIVPVLNSHIYKDFSLISSDTTLFCFKGTEIKFIEMFSQITKGFENWIISYFENQIRILDLNRNLITSIEVSFDLCDFSLCNEVLYCIDINEKLYTIDIKHSFNDSVNIIQFETCTFQKLLLNNVDIFIPNDLICKINNQDNTNEEQLCDLDQSTKRQCISNKDDWNLPFCNKQSLLSVNGKIFTVVNDSLKLLVNIKKFIYNVTVFKSYLIVSAGKTFIFHLKANEFLRAIEESLWSFTYQSHLYLCSKTGIKDFTFFKPNFYFKFTNFHLEPSQKLISLFSKYPILSDLTVDQKSFMIKCYRSSILFKDSFLNCFTQIRKNLICLGLIGLNNKGSIAFISISKKKIKTREVIDLEDIPLSICSISNRVCIISPTFVAWYKLEYGKIVFKGKIFHHGICKDSQFINKNEILLRNEDWSFCTVNLKTRKVDNFATEGAAIPFVISGQEGYGVGSQIFISKQILECGQIIEKIYSFGKFILIFCINGSIFQLKTTAEENVKSLYENEPVIINMSL